MFSSIQSWEVLLPVPTLKVLHMLTGSVCLLQASWALRALVRTSIWLGSTCLRLIIVYWICLQLAAGPSSRESCPLWQSLDFAPWC